jgi:hypothetical protein
MDRKAVVGLPPRCPLKTGNLIPECRFAPRLFRALHHDGFFEAGCPLEKACRMKGADDGNQADLPALQWRNH